MTSKTIVDHIMQMRQHDQDYARWAMLQYHAALPWLNVLEGVKIEIEKEKIK